MSKTLSFASLLLVLAACSEPAPEPVAASQQAVGSKDGWVGTWAAAPQADGTTFQDKTLRQIVRTSIGGTSVRVRLSNVFGNQPLVVDNLHVAQRSNGASIVAGSDRALKFAGQASLSIPAGQAATSDPIDFEVKPLSDLAVSFHLASSNNAGTAHGTALQDNYVANGNVAGDTALPGAQVRGSYYFLSNVDVQNFAAWGAVVTLGASITDGVASGGNNNRRWPNDLAKRLLDASIPVGVLNQGISGNRLLADGAGQSALKRFERDVLGQAGVRWVIFSDDPINDLGGGNPPSGEQLVDALKQLVAQAHAADVAFWCSTLTPFEGAGYWKPAGETGRAAVNAFVTSSSSGCDALVDQDAATHDPAKPTWYLPAYDAGDHLHPNEQGLQAIAAAVKLTGFTAPAEGVAGAGGGGASAGAPVVSQGGASAGASGAGASMGGASSAGYAGLGGSGLSQAQAGAAGQALPAGGGASTASVATDPPSGCSCRASRRSDGDSYLYGFALALLIVQIRRRGRRD